MSSSRLEITEYQIKINLIKSDSLKNKHSNGYYLYKLLWCVFQMEVTINFKAKAGDKVLAKNPRRNGKPEYFTIKYLNYLNFGTHERVRYEAVTCREAKNGKINVVIDNDDILEVCL